MMLSSFIWLRTVELLKVKCLPVLLYGFITCRRRPTSTWFDDDCRNAKRALRASEKAARRAGPLSNILPAIRAWRVQRRQYFELLHKKRSAFWSTRVDAEQSQPGRLWRSFDELLGRGHVPPSTLGGVVAEWVAWWPSG